MTARIDAHQHFWRVARGDDGWLTPVLAPLYRDLLPEDLAPLLAAAGIEGTVLVQAAPSMAETAFLLDLAERHDFVRGVVGWVDFEDAGAVAAIDRLAKNARLRGVRPMIQDIPDPGWMLRPAFAPIYRHLAARSLAFDALVLPRHLPRLLTLLERHPDLACVVDHAAKPEIRSRAREPWASDLRRIARETNAFCKLSGLVTEAARGWTVDDLRFYVDHVLEAFGPARVMWGSDWPVLLLAGDYPRWVEATDRLIDRLLPEERGRVLGGTARAFYGLA